jgi:hypothetical protein
MRIKILYRPGGKERMDTERLAVDVDEEELSSQIHIPNRPTLPYQNNGVGAALPLITLIVSA